MTIKLNIADLKKPSGSIETRSHNGEIILIDKSEKREGDELISTTPARITGHGAVWDTASTGLYFEEIIMRGAMDKADFSNCICLFNHDENMILGSVRARSLELTIDEKGLFYSCTPHDTQIIRDQVLLPMRAGDLNCSSFRFRMPQNDSADEWFYDEERNVVVRKIHEISSVLDVSPVLYPAYDAAESAVRNAEKIKSVMPDSFDSESRARLDHLNFMFMNTL